GGNAWACTGVICPKPSTSTACARGALNDRAANAVMRPHVARGCSCQLIFRRGSRGRSWLGASNARRLKPQYQSTDRGSRDVSPRGAVAFVVPREADVDSLV